MAERASDAPMVTREVMARIEADVKGTLRRHLVERGGAADYEDPELFDSVWSMLDRAVGDRNLDVLLLPELLHDNTAWRLDTHLHLSSHRRVLGPLILFVKRRLLLPLSRWLFEYAKENFRRQHQVNRVLFACVEELAIENARLRREVNAANARAPRA
jgi:hypothetical protein